MCRHARPPADATRSAGVVPLLRAACKGKATVGCMPAHPVAGGRPLPHAGLHAGGAGVPAVAGGAPAGALLGGRKRALVLPRARVVLMCPETGPFQGRPLSTPVRLCCRPAASCDQWGWAVRCHAGAAAGCTTKGTRPSSVSLMHIPPQVLHVFLPPPHLPTDCSPYAAWRLASAGSLAQQRERPAAAVAGEVTAMVAVAWQSSLSVYRAALLQRRPAGAPQPPQPPQPLPAPLLLRSWTLGRGRPAGSGGSLSSAGSQPSSPRSGGEAGVCGCHFLDSGPLVCTLAAGLPSVWGCCFSRAACALSPCPLGHLLSSLHSLLRPVHIARVGASPTPLQVVLSSKDETSTAVLVYRGDFLAPAAAGSSSAAGRGGHSGCSDVGTGGGGEMVEGLELRDWVVASPVRWPAFVRALWRCCVPLPAPSCLAHLARLKLVLSKGHHQHRTAFPRGPCMARPLPGLQCSPQCPLPLLPETANNLLREAGMPACFWPLLLPARTQVPLQHLRMCLASVVAAVQAAGPAAAGAGIFHQSAGCFGDQLLMLNSQGAHAP